MRAIFTTRGTTESVIASLIAGFVTVLLLQPGVAAKLELPEVLQHVAFPFQLCVGTLVAFLVAVAPKGRTETA